MLQFNNPYELSSIKSGYDLINFFKKLIPLFKKTPPNLLLKSNNLNLKFNLDENGNIDVLGDFGKIHPLDISGFSYSQLNDRFIGNDKIKKLYSLLFNIFNNAKTDIKNLLKKLKLFNSNYILNCNFTKSGNQNIFIINKIFKYTIKKDKRIFEEVNNKQNILEQLVLDLQPYAQKFNILITLNQKSRKLSDQTSENLYDDLLNTVYTIQIKPTLAISKTLRNWLRGCKNPKNKHIFINDIKLNIFNKKLYFKILNNIPISEIVDKNKFNYYKKPIINSFVMQLATQALGQRLLERLQLPDDNIDNVIGITYKNFQILGDNIIKNYQHYNEDEQQISSYISNPPYITSDWGRHVVTNESTSFKKIIEAFDLEQEPHQNLYVYFIFNPELFLKNDFELYNKYSNYFINSISKILIPYSKKVKFDDIKEIIKSFGVKDENIIEYNNKKINPLYEIYCNNNDKVLFIMEPDSKKYFKPDIKKTRKFTSIDSMKPYIDRNYIKIIEPSELNLLDFNIKTKQQFIKKYKNADDRLRDKLLISMFGNTNLKSIFNHLY